MSDKEIEILCKGGCGETFSTFLKEIKEQNTKVACPKCGKLHERPGPAKAGKDHSPKSG